MFWLSTWKERLVLVILGDELDKGIVWCCVRISQSYYGSGLYRELLVNREC